MSSKKFNLKNIYNTFQKTKSTRKFVNLNGVSRFLYCPICEDIFDNPVRLRCGHTFCQLCILIWAQQKNDCPLCRKIFQLQDIQPDLIGINMVNELEVYCINQGCPSRFKLSQLNEHLYNCYFDPEKMPQFIKEVVLDKTIKKNESKEKDSEVEDNGLDFKANINFNTKASLKARLYNKNKNLMEKVLSKNKINNTPTNETIKPKEKNILDILEENNLHI
jgi:hypothetical protein